MVWKLSVVKNSQNIWGLMEIPWTTQAVAKTMGWSLCTDCMAPLQRITPTHWPWRSWTTACQEPSALFSSVLGVERCSTNSQKRNRGTKPASKLLNMFCLHDILGQWGHRTCGSNQPMSDLTSSQHHETEPILDTGRPRTRDWLAQKPGVKPNTTLLV